MIMELKGPGKVVAFAQNEHQLFELLRYPDASWGIRKQGSMVGVWEPHEGVECMKHFVKQVGLGDEPLVWLLVPQQECAKVPALVPANRMTDLSLLN